MAVWIGAGLLAALVAFAAYVRLAPTDPRRWHVALPTDTRILEGACADSVSRITSIAGGQAACSLAEAPEAVLARLDAIAMATPRTTRIAGSPEEGRITWETRSRIMGFPDYTTAQAGVTGTMTRLDMLARQRFGAGDQGVNAARLTDWLRALSQE